MQGQPFQIVTCLVVMMKNLILDMNPWIVMKLPVFSNNGSGETDVDVNVAGPSTWH